MATNNAEKFLQQYIHFCRSPLRTAKDIKADLGRLSTLPMVAQMAFAHKAKIRSTLLVALRPLALTDPNTGRRHFIGNFVVYITRHHNNPDWMANFELVNLNPVYRDSETICFHPHMLVEAHPEIGDVAQICIANGRYPIFQYIRKGQLDVATELIINLLRSLGPYNPFYDISHWPLSGRKS